MTQSDPPLPLPADRPIAEQHLAEARARGDSAKVASLVAGVQALHNREMAEVAAALNDAGFSQVRTVLASGNVLLESASGVAAVRKKAEAALRDTGANTGAVARAIDTVAGIRQIEISGRTPTPMGGSNNYPRSVAKRIGASPARAILEPIGGQGPQHLVTELAGVIAAAKSDVAVERIASMSPLDTAVYHASTAAWGVAAAGAD